MRKENINGSDPAGPMKNIEPEFTVSPDLVYPVSPRKRGRAGRIVRVIIILAVLALVALAAWRLVSDRLAPVEVEIAPPVNVRVATAVLTDLSSSSILTGRLQAVNEVSILPKVPGEVTALYVSLGDKISKGKVLFEMDKTQVSTALNQAQQGLDDAQTNLDRMTALYAEGAVPLQLYEQAQSAYNMAQQSYKAAGDAFGNTSVTAPISGYVTSVNVAVGAIASQAMPAVTIANIDRLEISASLSEQLINKVQLNDIVGVLVKSVSGDPLPGTVTAISPAPATGSLTYPIIVTLDNADTAVKPGMFAEVIIASDRVEGILAIPSKAILIKSGRQTVVTLGDGDQVLFNDIVTGVDNGEMVEIKEGLREGDRVVVEGQAYLDETSQVNITE
ncbi:MAG: efflux RND transporter periplasmic adaptor subunit [Clostridiales Family XIII bacterium]|nr:efflux RND transporter periplasmic adaptor subunit [Clostridiales Family XIII bacterium]